MSPSSETIRSPRGGRLGSASCITMAPLSLRQDRLRVLLLCLFVSLIVGCGGGITPEPTETLSVPPTETPTVASTLSATATLPPSSPTPSSTPTLTPTPIVHVVESGETPLGIAQQYDVDVDLLMAVNGIENPQSLREGDELVIPTGNEVIEPTPAPLLPTPTPVPYGVRGVACYETPVGSVECLGELVNTSSFSLINVLVEVALVNDTGTLMAADTFATADVIPAGARSPFRVLFTAPPSGWVRARVTPRRGQAGDEVLTDYVPITVTEVEGAPSGSQFEVVGTVRNEDAERSAEQVSIIVTTYDGSGAVTAGRHFLLTPEEPLQPLGLLPFSVRLSGYGDDPADFRVLAIGRISAE